MNASRDLPRLAAVLAIGVFAFLPMARLPAFYNSFLYLVFFWISLSTSWALLSGFAGYFSLGHAAFFGVGMYTTAVLTTKFGCRSCRPCRSRRRCRRCWPSASAPSCSACAGCAASCSRC